MRRSPTQSPFAPTAAAAPPRSFTCGRCTDVFPNFETLQRHVDKLNHFRCTTRGCRRDFDSRAELTAHRSGCRPTLSIKTEPSQSSFQSTPSQIWPLAASNSANASVLEDIALRRQRVLRAAQRPGAYSPGTKPRYVFMDTDNIIFSMLNNRHLHTLVPGAKFSNALRLQFDNFTQRVCNSRDGGRDPQVKMLRASYYGAADVLAQSLVRFGWGIAKREPAWDPNLEQQLLMQSSPASPSTLVLVTGDGNPSKSGYGDQSFRSVADKFLKLGWCVEIHAWAHSIHEGFLRLMEDNPTRVLVRLIDETEDLSGLVFAGKYNPCVAAVPSPRFRSQPPSPVHSPLDSTTSMGSVSSRFLFDDDDVLRIKPKNHTNSVPQKQQQQQQQLPQGGTNNDRLAMLTCKLSGLVFTEPVLLSCCGETINNSSYATMKSCPFCQSMSPSAMPNRAIQNILRVVAADPLH